MTNDRYLIVIGLCLCAILYIDTVDTDIKNLKKSNEALIQKEKDRTEYLEQTQKNMIEAYTLGYTTALDNNICKE